jgi:hypothetical protein
MAIPTKLTDKERNIFDNELKDAIGADKVKRDH